MNGRTRWNIGRKEKKRRDPPTLTQALALNEIRGEEVNVNFPLSLKDLGSLLPSLILCHYCQHLDQIPLHRYILFLFFKKKETNRSLHENLGKRPSDCFAKFPAERVESKPILHPIPLIEHHLLLPLSREHTYLQYNTGHFQVSPIFFSRSLSSTSTPSLCLGYQVLTLIIQ